MNARFLVPLALAALVACGGAEGSGDTPRSRGVDLTGAGATFPYPLYNRWTTDYLAERGVRINYQSLGSGAGIQQLAAGTVDFGASDAPMTDEEISRARGGAVVHIPTTIGAVTVSYNLEGLTEPLRLTGELVADMYLGRVTRWNDARIAALNPGVTLPAAAILPVHRSDGSGTTYVFTEYLSAVSPAWRSGPGTGKEVAWPTGIGAKGNEGVASQVKSSPGTVGYIEVVYANQNRLAKAAIQNAAGNWVLPNSESITAAAAGVADTLSAETDYRVSIINAPGDEAYSISSFTWVLLYRVQPDTVKGRKLVEFLRWAVTDGQQRSAAMDYGPLPQQMRDRLVARLETVQIGGATP
ncbi:MAG TPA: phosphate ABC transporter substrate-binding protein PstS [Gemmatimonadaceae bacterium]|nr:phosphate ABC transporter substrate-binding protein PstS [Gemmatimonadaceae bacterium]